MARRHGGRRATVRGSVVLSALLSLGAIITPAAARADAPRCWDAAPGITDFDDFEFDARTQRAVWQQSPIINEDGTIKTPGVVTIAPVDADGNILLSQRFDCTDCNPTLMVIRMAGPEFAYTGSENYVYFTAMTADQRSVRIARLRERQQGGWELSHLPDSDGMIMQDVGDTPNGPYPRVVYIRVSGDLQNVAAGWPRARFRFENWGWRDDGPLPTDTVLNFPTVLRRDPAEPWLVHQGRMFNDGALRAHTWPAPLTLIDILLNRVRYVPALYEFQTRRVTPLAATAAAQLELSHRSIPRAFSAPELGGRAAIVSEVRLPNNAGYAVAVWRQTVSGAWEEWARIPAVAVDPAYPCLYHSEGFAVNGRSYIVTEAYQPLMCAFEWKKLLIPTPSKVWIASVDPTLSPAEQVRRVISTERDPAKVSWKTDAEALVIGGTTARIYFRDQIDFVASKQAIFTVCDPGL